MLRMLHRLRKLQYALTDALVLQAAYILSIQIIKTYFEIKVPSALKGSFFIIIITVLCIGQFILYNIYTNDVFNEKLFPFKRNIKIITAVIISVIASEYLIIIINKGFGVRIQFVIVYLVSVIVMMLLFRLIFVLYFRFSMGFENSRSNIFFIGRSKDKAEYDKFLTSHNYLNTHIAGFIKTDDGDSPASYAEDIKNLTETVKINVIDEVVISGNLVYNKEIKSELSRCRDMGIVITVLIDIYDEVADGARKTVYENFPCIKYSDATLNAGQLFIKRVIDVVGATIGMVIFIILFIFVAPLIKLESKGPVFFKQKRVGKNGREFTMYKFRSMYFDAEERKKDYIEQNQMTGHMFKLENDPRITKIGKLIRKTSIDELPQFFNVLIGDMSLVGTRPPTLDEVNLYEYRHYKRLAAIPGITGKWQISGRSQVTDFEEVVKMDVEYIIKWTIWEDIRIILKTIEIVILGRGAK